MCERLETIRAGHAGGGGDARSPGSGPGLAPAGTCATGGTAGLRACLAALQVPAGAVALLIAGMPSAVKRSVAAGE